MPKEPQIVTQLRRRVHSHPGLPLSDHLSALGTSWSVIYAALKHLQEHDQVRTIKEGRFRILLPPGKAKREEPRHLILLQGPTARQLAEIIAENPGHHTPDTIVYETGHAHRVVYYHLRRLLEAGLIKSAKTTRFVELAPTPALLRVLNHLAPRTIGGNA